ncbi:NLR family CARD domain-containing protein 3 [Sarotherodon galilaeus]
MRLVSRVASHPIKKRNNLVIEELLKISTNCANPYMLHQVDPSSQVEKFVTEETEEQERESQGIDYFAHYHPQQNTSSAVVIRVFSCKDGTKRKWLTHCKERHLLFCFVCLVFARRTDTSAFIAGMSDWRHVHLRTEEHEKSTTHHTCAEGFFLRFSKFNISSLFAGSQVSAHRAQVKKRRQVLEPIVDVVKVLGKRGLSYVEIEAAYTLADNTIDHEHLTDCIEKSEKLHQSNGSRTRGSLITLLSKTTVNSVTDALGHLIQESIASHVQKVGMFSVQLDTTPDITGYDQCSVMIRYVTEAVQERLVSIVRCEGSTGQYFVNWLLWSFSALMTAQYPTHVHVWCYAQILNLPCSSRSPIIGRNKPKSDALQKIFGHFGKPDDGLKSQLFMPKHKALKTSYLDDNTDMEVEDALPEKRAKKRKGMAGEMTEDELQINAEKSNEVKVHNTILDTVTEAIHRRFVTHGPLVVDLAWMDPRTFSQVRTVSLPSNALQNRSMYDYRTRRAKDEEWHEESETVTKSCDSCKNCRLRCYQILRRFNMLSDAYCLLGLYLLTISLAQVACERTFSLSANRLESFMLMATEKDILMSLDSDMIIDRVAEKRESCFCNLVR